MTLRSRLVIICCLLATVVCVTAAITIAVLLYRAASLALRAETNLHANCLVVEVLKAYLKQHPGSWPKRWEDLEQTSIPDESQGGYLQWPRDIDEIRTHVRIDFGLTGAQVAAMSVETFSAIEPIGPTYGRCEERMGGLLEVAREKTTAK